VPVWYDRLICEQGRLGERGKGGVAYRLFEIAVFEIAVIDSPRFSVKKKQTTLTFFLIKPLGVFLPKVLATNHPVVPTRAPKNDTKVFRLLYIGTSFEFFVSTVALDVLTDLVIKQLFLFRCWCFNHIQTGALKVGH